MNLTNTVQSIYVAFGKGDVPVILECLAEDVVWEYAYEHASNQVPWLKTRQGKDEVAAFFGDLAALDFHRFEATELLEGAGVVVALVHLESTVRATGKLIAENDEAHIWRFNASGKVARFRHCADTFQQWQAMQR